MTSNVEHASRSMSSKLSPRHNLRHDLPAGLVVFLVALPLCLGIAFASGAPLVSGLISGIVAGLIVSPLSKSSLSVSGPAAGLFVIVLNAIGALGFEAFLTAVCVAGLIQLVLGYLRAGIVAYYFPTSVIKGMLAGIGLVLILKQLPHAFGWDHDWEGDLEFFQPDGRNTFSEITDALGHVDLAATFITLVGLGILIAWRRVPALRRLRFVPGPLVVVFFGVTFNLALKAVSPELAVDGELLVSIPDLGTLLSELRFPDPAALGDVEVYKTAGVIAAVASIETLLCVEAIDKLDPFKRSTPTSHELKAQGVGNMLAGLLGGLPMTAVIVRGSANVQSGGRTWVSSFFHGVLLLAAVVSIPAILSQIPLAALAAILLFIGYQLAPIPLFRRMYRQGRSQFLPFVVTAFGILLTDLLIGVLVGMGLGIFYVLKAHVSAPYFLHHISKEDEDGHDHVCVELSENVSFLNKAALNELLHSINDGAVVEIDASNSQHIDDDAIEVLHDFVESAPLRDITVILRGLDPHLQLSGLPASNHIQSADAVTESR